MKTIANGYQVMALIFLTGSLARAALPMQNQQDRNRQQPTPNAQTITHPGQRRYRQQPAPNTQSETQIVAGPGQKRYAQQNELMVTAVTKIAQLTGHGSINHTDAFWQVMGTDLGIICDTGYGNVLIAFGDTFGNNFRFNTDPKVWSPQGENWRSNVLAFSNDRTAQTGLRFGSMATVTDRPGYAREVLSSLKKDGKEKTVIPNGCVAANGNIYMHYMSINHWSPEMKTNFSGLAVSRDRGDNWTKLANVTWGSASGFALAAMAADGDYVYMFGTATYRSGPVKIARVLKSRIEDKNSFEYWTGSRWVMGQEGAAAQVIPAPVGELSVQYNSNFKRWIMLYLNGARYQIVLRDAPALTGPWSEEKTLVTGKDYPQLYGGYIHPWFNSGDVYFTMSQWQPYNVFWMRASLAFPRLLTLLTCLPATLPI